MIFQLILLITTVTLSSAVFNGPSIAHIKTTTPQAPQQQIDADDGWHMFFFSSRNILASPQFTICSNTPTLLRVTDAFCSGDTFEVYANGTKIGSTEIRGTLSEDCEDPLMKPEEAFFSKNMSHVEVELPAGAYGVNLLAESSPFGGGIGYIRLDSKDVVMLI